MPSNPVYKTHIARLMVERGLITPRTAPVDSPSPSKNSLTAQPVLANANLTPRTTPLSRQEAAHLLRRASYGAAPLRLQALIGMPANEAVSQLFAEAAAAPKPEEPDWASLPPVDWRAPLEEQLEFIDKNFRWFEDMQVTMLHEMQQHGLREKMTMFWANLLVTDYDTHGVSAVAYRYVELLRDEGLGNFKDLVHAIGRDMAMLYYLDGFLSEIGEPNENYARELLELFTMGINDKNGNPNYTQSDIEEIARALTGWKVDLDSLSVNFAAGLFDAGTKTIFGQTGNWGYDQVIDIIFEQRADQISHYICSRMYREFVYHTPNEEVVEQMVTLFKSSGFDIKTVMQTLISSEHFFSADVIGGRFKSPSELYVGMVIEAGVTASSDRAFLDMVYGVKNSGQALLNPPNVAGWPGYRSWLTTSSVADRFQYIGFYVSNFYIPDDALLAMANSIHDASDANAAFRLPLALATHFSPVAVEQLFIDPVSGDLSGGVQPVPDEFANGPDYVLDLTKRLLEGTPWYEWDLSQPGAIDRVRRFLIYLYQLPEIHLN
ncbi:MAG: DUF1800 domain-containing protein [Bacteroidota bacterium]